MNGLLLRLCGLCVSARGDELLLDVSAPTQDGIKAVQAMFGELRPRASTAGVGTV